MQNLQSNMEKKIAEVEWSGEPTEFEARAMDLNQPYFVLSCGCGCRRLKCKAEGSISVLPVNNFHPEWCNTWLRNQ